jgi:hypothetical protein
MTTHIRPLSPAAIQIWAWLFPLTYLFHIAEEYWVAGGYSAYLYKLRGVHLSTTRFLVAQAVGVALITIGVLIARWLKFSQIMIVILGATVLVNSLSHIITSAVYFSYGPGLWSSIFLWFPLGLASLIRFYPHIKRKKYWIALAIGFGINVAISIFTLRGGRLQ